MLVTTVNFNCQSRKYTSGRLTQKS